jgi:hypothetical protein
MSIREYQRDAKATIASWNLRRKFFWALAILILGVVAYYSFYIFYPYSEGTRTGYVRKLSHKGFVFKTWEGELQMPMTTAAAPTDGSQMALGGNVWSFSVSSSNKQVIQSLQKAEQAGARVTLHYTQYLKQFDWRGETVYFINQVSQAPQ